MYLVIIIIINFEEDIQRSFQELRLDVNSPELELELELKCLELELELELKCIVSSGIGIGIGIENNGIGIGIELKKRNWPQPWHYLNQCQCWDIVNWTPRNKLQWNFNQNTKLFIHENVVCEMAAIFSRGRWVELSISLLLMTWWL